jgi:hypothetical protein
MRRVHMRVLTRFSGVSPISDGVSFLLLVDVFADRRDLSEHRVDGCSVSSVIPNAAVQVHQNQAVSLPVSTARPLAHSKHAELRFRFLSNFSDFEEAY